MKIAQILLEKIILDLKKELPLDVWDDEKSNLEHKLENRYKEGYMDGLYKVIDRIEEMLNDLKEKK